MFNFQLIFNFVVPQEKNRLFLLPIKASKNITNAETVHCKCTEISSLFLLAYPQELRLKNQTNKQNKKNPRK